MIDIKDGKLRISVRNLVEFICKSGDIDNRFAGVTEKSAMEAGSKAHKKIQKSMGPDYHSEVILRFEKDEEKYSVSIEGRADGIFESDGITYIDEIKGTYKNVKYFTEPVYVHKAQAMCYAYFYCRDNGLDKAGIRVTYVNLDTEDVRFFEEILTFEEIESWFTGVYRELLKWADYVCEHKSERTGSIKGLKFPFEYRKGQRDLAVNVYRAVAGGMNLFIQAPTGVGKTISTVYPSVMSMGQGKGDKIFYLTAKTTTRTAAEETFEILRNGGLCFKTVTITAKDKVCFLESETGPDCNPAVCPYAKGHNDRVNDAVYDIICSESAINRQTIEKYARKHNVCPFEFCLDVSYWVDGIICDYNYVFDPHVCLKRYFADGARGDYIFLVDEAHNLVDRAREMYSASMYKEDFLAVRKLIPAYGKSLIRALERCNGNLLAYKRECDGDYAVIEDKSLFAVNMRSLALEITKFIELHRDFQYMRELTQFYFDVMHYNYILECRDANYLTYTEHTERGFMIKQFCVNPSGNLKLCISRGRAVIFFSATLLPVNYYKELLSGNKDDYAIYARSPFDTSKRFLAVGKDVTSRYTRRNENEFKKIAEYICTVSDSRVGNYLVFFPSYKFLESVYNCMPADSADRYELIIQNQNMSESDKEEFLEKFGENTGLKSLIGMCVMGGVFSEGIDLKNDRLIGVIVVGTGLPAINTSSELLRRFYDEKEGCGFEYAYVYPGMNKVLQAAGRVIRTDEDRGIILLLDDRFLGSTYRNLFPAEWSDCKAVTKDSVYEEILDFWNQ